MSEAELKQLLTKRTALKKTLTRFKTYLLKATKDDSCQIKLRLNKIDSIIDEFGEVQTKIEILDSAELESEYREDFENSYYDAISIANKLLSENQITVVDVRNSTETIESGNIVTNSSVGTSAEAQDNIIANVRIPVLDLPTFNGSYESWLSFRDSFQSVIHNNNVLSKVQKFYYLRSSLKDDAAKAIQFLEASDANYDVAWELLNKRFENKRVIIYKYVSSLCDFDTIGKESRVALREMLSNITQNIRALKALEQPTEYWDTIIIYLMSSKLDTVTKREWETATANNELPTLEQFEQFLTTKCQILERLIAHASKSSGIKTNNDKAGRSNDHKTKAFVATSAYKCYFCKGTHMLYNCETFLKLNGEDRLKEIRKLKLCTNCLKNHATKNCHSLHTCNHCNKRHNTLLHIEGTTAQQEADPVMNDSNKSNVVAHSALQSTHTLLSTVLAQIQDKFGKMHTCRILLDCGSQSNFIAQSLCEKLCLPLQEIHVSVTGIGQVRSNINYKTVAVLKSCHSSYSFSQTYLVTSHITSNLPSIQLDISQIKIPANIKLADPHFCKPGPVDILLGANIFWDLMCTGQIKLGRNQPVLQKTLLGWIVAGPMMNTISNAASKKVHLNVEDQLSKFWEVEELSIRRPSQEESQCEEHFVRNTTRGLDGRFTVSLPIIEDSGCLGESRETALKRMYSVERKLSRNDNLKLEYQQFMKEYEQLGHMSEVSETDAQKDTCYLPHHPVIKETSTTTKVRVVFDASAPTSNGISLNNKLMVGPTIQQDLFSIMCRFRTHRYVLTGDVEKMYRQILVATEQRDLQRILWRSDSTEQIRTYRLNTVTYGTAPAPFLATRCLKELSDQNKTRYPETSRIVAEDFYMDDLLTGGDSVEEVQRIKREVIEILQSAGFPLRKLSSNNKQIISEDSDKPLQFTDDAKVIKTLGIQWDSRSDSITYSINTDLYERSTKRTVLSTISQIFDPLGLVGPVVILAKIILQRLWKLQLTWDESVPLDLHTSWTRIKSELPELNNLYLPRAVVCSSPVALQIHGFSDASETAYGACLYLRSTDSSGHHHVHLICAKSRVAPLKTVSLPRLELCAALLLAQLFHKVQQVLHVSVEGTYLWSDSTIALGWIATSAQLLKTFVANRVTEIQELTKTATWGHVRSTDNPADKISRGVEPNKLKHLSQWWAGPEWLSQHQDFWPNSAPNSPEELPELKQHIVTLVSIKTDPYIFQRYSSLRQLQRIVAYCLRFEHNALHKTDKKVGELSVEEMNNALNCLIRLVQRSEFSREFHYLTKHKTVSKTNKLFAFQPFIDSQGIIRVGGRLANSNLSYNQIHPVILPSNHQFTDLIIRNEHHKQLHAGTEALLASIRLNYWILAGKNAVKRILRQCNTCFRTKPRVIIPPMGDLPSARTNPARPFLNCGTDFAGPFTAKETKYRNKRFIKVYICIFVCFTTKAVHIEVVSDLTTECFLNCLKRFFARRGKCANIYCDNGTNFVGARNDLQQLSDFLLDPATKKDVTNFLSSDFITWHFIPARSPHFGGLWEAAVKSAKTHLKRVMGKLTFSLEQFHTILTQVEACLNSRPLCLLSTDPQDLVPLTPGHFLIGTALTALPELDYKETPTNRLSHYQHLQKVVQHFWSRWSRDYLSQLQSKRRWNSSTACLQPGMVVILHEDNLPPLQWRLGRILELHTGKDGVCRVVTVQTSNQSKVKRAVRKLSVLPNQ